jgi:hypothetical protein
MEGMMRKFLVTGPPERPATGTPRLGRFAASTICLNSNLGEFTSTIRRPSSGWLLPQY